MVGHGCHGIKGGDVVVMVTVVGTWLSWLQGWRHDCHGNSCRDTTVIVTI